MALASWAARVLAACERKAVMSLWATSLETINPLVSLQVQLLPMLNVPTPQSFSL